MAPKIKSTASIVNENEQRKRTVIESDRSHQKNRSFMEMNIQKFKTHKPQDLYLKNAKDLL